MCAELELFISELVVNTFLKTDKKRMPQRQTASTVQTAKDINTRKSFLVSEQEPFSLFSIEDFPNYPLTLNAVFLSNW